MPTDRELLELLGAEFGVDLAKAEDIAAALEKARRGAFVPAGQLGLFGAARPSSAPKDGGGGKVWIDENGQRQVDQPKAPPTPQVSWADVPQTPKAPEPMPDTPDYETFARLYRDTFKRMMEYKPSEAGSTIYAGKLATLADRHPEWAERVESEGEGAAAEPQKPEVPYAVQRAIERRETPAAPAAPPLTRPAAPPPVVVPEPPPAAPGEAAPVLKGPRYNLWRAVDLPPALRPTNGAPWVIEDSGGNQQLYGIADERVARDIAVLAESPEEAGELMQGRTPKRVAEAAARKANPIPSPPPRSGRNVQNPGSRGAVNWWIDDHGTVRYDDRPENRIGPYMVEQRADGQFELLTQQHVGGRARGRKDWFPARNGFAGDRAAVEAEATRRSLSLMESAARARGEQPEAIPEEEVGELEKLRAILGPLGVEVKPYRRYGRDEIGFIDAEDFPRRSPKGTFKHINPVMQQLRGRHGREFATGFTDTDNNRFVWAVRVENVGAVLAELEAKYGVAGGPGGRGAVGPGVGPKLTDDPRELQAFARNLVGGGGKPGEPRSRKRDRVIPPEALDALERLRATAYPVARSQVAPSVVDALAAHGMALLPHQLESTTLALDAMADGKRMFLLGDQTGTGKSYILHAFLGSARPKRALMVVPNANLVKQMNDDGKPFGQKVQPGLPSSPDEDGWFVLTYAGLRQAEKSGALARAGLFDVALFDEVHRDSMKTHEDSGATKTGKLVRKIAGTRARFSIYSTATPYEKPYDTHYLDLMGLWEGDWGPGGFEEWTEKYGVTWRTEIVPNSYGGEKEIRVPSWRGSPYAEGGPVRDMLALRAELIRAGVAAFHEVRPDVKVVSPFKTVPLAGGEYADPVERMVHGMDEAFAEATGLERAAYVNILKRMADYSKLDQAVEDAVAAVKAGRHAAVFVSNKSGFDFDYYRDGLECYILYSQQKAAGMVDGPPPKGCSRIVAAVGAVVVSMGLTGKLPSPTGILHDRIAAELGPKSVKLFTGDIKAEKRDAIKDEFQADKLPVIVATIAAGGTGLSLHDKRGKHPRTQINIGLPWTGRDLAQLVGRTVRVGTVSDVVQRFILTDHPEEQRVAGVIAGRMEALQAGVTGITASHNVDELREFELSGAVSDEEEEMAAVLEKSDDCCRIGVSFRAGYARVAR